MAHTVSSREVEWPNSCEEKLEDTLTPHNSAEPPQTAIQSENHKRALDIELSYEEDQPSSSFDPYGFKLSPEHSSHTLLDPDEAELSPELADSDLAFDLQAPSSQPDQHDFELYEFGISASQVAQDSDPYGFKLSPEPENQEVLNLCSQDHSEPVELFSYGDNKQVESSHESQAELLNPENQEVLELCSDTHQGMDVSIVSHQEDQDLFNSENMDLCCNENQELLDPFDHENQEVVEPCHNTPFENLLEPSNYDNQEVLEPGSYNTCDVRNFPQPENQEVPGLDNLDLSVGQEHDFHNSENHGNQEVLPEANNNQRVTEAEVSISPTTNSSDSDVASDDLLGLELSNSTAHGLVEDVCRVSQQDRAASNTSFSRNLLEGDLSTVFGAGGYIGCADVADDLEPLDRRQAKPVKEPARSVAPVRPPRPSLRVR